MCKARDYYAQKDKFFIFSDITKDFMQKHNLPGTVTQFKALVTCSKPCGIVRTGIYDRHTKVYRIADFKFKQTSIDELHNEV